MRDLVVRRQLPERRIPLAKAHSTSVTPLVTKYELDDGTFVLVASDANRIYAVEKAILRAFAIASGVSLLLAVSGGFILGRSFLRRLEVFNRVSREIMEGHLGARIPVLHRDDELDRLAVRLNATFDRLESVMESLKQVSSDVAHDLRTPLSRLRQTLELVRMAAHDVDEVRAATIRGQRGR